MIRKRKVGRKELGYRILGNFYIKCSLFTSLLFLCSFHNMKDIQEHHNKPHNQEIMNNLKQNKLININ